MIGPVKFKKGDKVKLSELGLEKLYPKFAGVQRQGIVHHVTNVTGLPMILWNGRKHYTDYSIPYKFLELDECQEKN